MYTFRATAAVAWTLLTACAPREPDSRPESPLLASIQATTAGDSVHFLMWVTNTGAEPVELEFSSGRTFELLVHQDDVVLWSSSEGRAFTQALRSDTLDSGETRSFEASWAPAANARGEMWVTGVLRDVRSPVEQSARFLIP